MTTDNLPERPNLADMSPASRRDFMKVAGVGALGLMYTHPIVETLHGGGSLGRYDGDPTGGKPSSSHPSNPSSSYPGPSSSSL